MNDTLVIPKENYIFLSLDLVLSSHDSCPIFMPDFEFYRNY